jgi:prevent-host-death family protein
MEETISVTDFKAKCLDLLKRLGRRELRRVTVTRRGEVVAVIMPPASDEDAVRATHGFMAGSVIVPPGIDLTRPVLQEAFDAAAGKLHR